MMLKNVCLFFAEPERKQVKEMFTAIKLKKKCIQKHTKTSCTVCQSSLNIHFLIISEFVSTLSRLKAHWIYTAKHAVITIIIILDSSFHRVSKINTTKCKRNSQASQVSRSKCIRISFRISLMNVIKTETSETKFNENQTNQNHKKNRSKVFHVSFKLQRSMLQAPRKSTNKQKSLYLLTQV